MDQKTQPKQKFQGERFLRLPQIIGQREVTPEQAKANRENGKYPRSPRPHIDPIIPVSRAAWWAGVKSGKYPQPIKLGSKTTVWASTSVYSLIESPSQDFSRRG